MRKSFSIASAIAILLAAETALAVTIYVDNQLGSDRATGLAAEPSPDNGPVRSVAGALARAQKSDRIVLANTGQPYREMISLSLPEHSGRPDRPFVIEGNGAVVDGTVVAGPGAWRHVEGEVFAMRPRRLTYQQLFLDGKPLTRAELLSKYEVAVLKPLEWALFDGQIFFRCEENRLPDDYDLRHAGLQTGITMYDVRHVRIENLVVQGFQQDGINAHELVRDCELMDIDSRANGRAGLSVGGVSNVIAVRCNFYNNGRVQVRTEGLAELQLTGCDVDSTNVPAFLTRGRRLSVDGRPVMAP